jgi:hypothetical protein
MNFTNEKSRIWIRIRKSRGTGSEDPIPNQNITDPEHWSKTEIVIVRLGFNAKKNLKSQALN